MTRRALVKRLERAAMRAYSSGMSEFYAYYLIRHGGKALSNACAALAAHDRRKKNG